MQEEKISEEIHMLTLCTPNKTRMLHLSLISCKIINVDPQGLSTPDDLGLAGTYNTINELHVQIHSRNTHLSRQQRIPPLTPQIPRRRHPNRCCTPLMNTRRLHPRIHPLYHLALIRFRHMSLHRNGRYRGV